MNELYIMQRVKNWNTDQPVISTSTVISDWMLAQWGSERGHGVNWNAQSSFHGDWFITHIQVESNKQLRQLKLFLELSGIPWEEDEDEIDLCEIFAEHVCEITTWVGTNEFD